MGALALLALVHQLRKIGFNPHPTVDYLVGILPNFAAAIAITFVLASIWSDQRKKADVVSTKQAFLFCSAFSGVGLVAWELIQRSNADFVFDFHDIGATLLGVIVSIAIFPLVLPKQRDDLEE